MELSSDADQAWSVIERTYLDAGYPPYQVWYFEPNGDPGAIRELEAARLIKPAGAGRNRYGLDWAGHWRIVDENEITDEAFDTLQQLGRTWEENKFPPIRSFAFQAPPGDTTVNELQARGFVEWRAAGRFELTDYGQDWIMEHRTP